MSPARPVATVEFAVAAVSPSPPVPGEIVSPTVAVAALFPLLTLATLGYWVYLDAKARESAHPVRWAVEVTLVPPLIAAYVYYRGERTRSQSDRERLALTALLALLTAMLVGTVFSPPDVFAQPRNTFGALLVTLPLFYLLVYKGEAEAEGGGGERDEASDGDSGTDRADAD